MEPLPPPPFPPPPSLFPFMALTLSPEGDDGGGGEPLFPLLPSSFVSSFAFQREKERKGAGRKVVASLQCRLQAGGGADSTGQTGAIEAGKRASQPGDTKSSKLPKEGSIFGCIFFRSSLGTKLSKIFLNIWLIHTYGS